MIIYVCNVSNDNNTISDSSTEKYERDSDLWQFRVDTSS